MSKVIDYIWLNECIEYRKISSLLERFGSVSSVLVADKESLLEVLTLKEAEKILKRDYKKAEEILAECFTKNIQIIPLNDSLYPEKLKNIENPPLCLYVKGRIPDFELFPVITVVGTRDATPYGLKVSRYLCEELAKSGAIIVSGMALGIDAIANQSALYAGKPTVAVLGCSVDICYPPSNRGIYKDIIATGAVISEFPPITEVSGRNFPRRNRIMSGLSDGVIIIEAPARSGALITAELALEQGKDVFTVPGPIDSSNSCGSNNLLKNGAIPVTHAMDIVNHYEEKFAGLKYQDTVNLKSKIDITPINATKTKKVKNVSKPKKIDVDLVGNELLIYNTILAGNDTPDKIIQVSKLPVHVTMSCITILEVKGFVSRVASKIKIKEKK